MYKEKQVSDFAKGLILENNIKIKDFIRNFKGGQGDKEDFGNLCLAIDCNKLGIPTEIQKKIDDFIEKALAPMVYEHDTVFSEARYIGTMIDGVQHIDSEEDAKKMCVAFIRVLLEIEKQWDDFVEEELKPYLV